MTLTRVNTYINIIRRGLLLFLLNGVGGSTNHIAARSTTGCESDSLWLRGIDPYYLQVFVGMNKSANENMPWSEMTKHPLSTGAFVGVGKEFTRLWGGRLGLGIDNNKSRNVPLCESSEAWNWNDAELFGDLTFDITDLFRTKTRTKTRTGYEEERVPKFNLKAFAGVGGLLTYSFPTDIPLSYTYQYSTKNQLCFGYRAGLTATYLVDSNLRLAAELSHTVVTDNFNGVKNSAQPNDHRTNLMIGIAYVMGQTHTRTWSTENIKYAKALQAVPTLSLIAPNREEEKLRHIDGTAYLDFPVSETTIYPNYRKNQEELNRIKATVDSALFDQSIQLLSINLHGYASPESPLSNNRRLATGRTAALANYLKNEYGFNDNNFITESTPEDWENLRIFIDQCDRLDDNRAPLKAERGKRISKVDKSVITHREELLRVIDNHMELDNKEEMLKRVGNGKPYKWLLENIYPGLRHTDYTIEYKVQDYQVKDAKRLIYTHPEALSVEEIYQLALTYPEKSDNRYDALVIAARQYPENKVANYNAAVACIQSKRLKSAKKYLEHAGNTPETEYLRVVIDAMEGRIDWVMSDGKVIKL